MPEDIGNAQGRVIIDVSQIDQAVARVQQAAQRILAYMAQVDEAISAGDAASIAEITRLTRAQADLTRASAQEQIAQAKLVTAQTRAESEKRIQQAQAEAKATAQIKQQNAVQTAGVAQQAAQNKTVDQALSAWDKQAAAANKAAQAGVEAQNKMVDQALTAWDKQAAAATKTAAQEQSAAEKAAEAEIAAQNRVVANALSAWDKQAAAANKNAATQKAAADALAARTITVPGGGTLVSALDPGMQASAQQGQALEAQRQKAIADAQADAVKLNAAMDKFKQSQGVQTEVDVKVNLGSAQAAITQATTEFSALENQLKQLQSLAPPDINLDKLRAQFAESKQPIADLQAQLGKLKSDLSVWTGDPAEAQRLIQQFNEVRQAALEAATSGLDPLRASVQAMDQQVETATTGVRGFFNNLRDGLQEVNRQGLGKNIQELGFRLSPAGLAAGAGLAQGVSMAETLQETNLSFTSFTGSEEKAKQLMADLTQQAAKLGLPVTNVLTTMQRFAPTIRAAGGDINNVIDLAARLLTLNPGAGFETAVMAITKGLGGTDRSLLTQFNVLPDTIAKAEKETGTFAAGLDKVLNEMGRTTDLAQKFGNDTRSAFTRAQDAINLFLAKAVEPLLNLITPLVNKFSDFLNTISNTAPAIAPVIGALLAAAAAGTGLVFILGNLVIAWEAINRVRLAYIQTQNADIAVATADAAAQGASAAAAAAGNDIRAAAGFNSEGVVAGAAGMGVLSSLSSVVAVVLPAIIAAIGTTALMEQLANQPGSAVDQRLKTDPTKDFGGNLVKDFNVFVDDIKKGVYLVVAGFQDIIVTAGISLYDAFEQVVNKVDLFGTKIASAFNDIVGKIGDLMVKVGQALGPFGAALVDSGGQLSSSAAARDQSRIVVTDAQGNKTTHNVNNMQQGADSDNLVAAYQRGNPGSSVQFFEGFSARIDRLSGVIDKLSDPSVLAAAVQVGVQTANTQLYNSMFPSPAPSTDTGKQVDPAQAMLDKFNTAIKSDDFSKLVDAVQKNIEDRGKLITQFMDQTARTQEDRTISANREMYDYIVKRSQEVADFQKQQAQQQEDFDTQRQRKVDDFNREIAQMESDAKDQRIKAQKDYNKQAEKAQADFNKQMLRMSRDVDDAISARDFLSAQKALQKMADAKQDFSDEQKARLDDYNQQIKDLNDNLAKQEALRKEDQDRSLKQMDDDFAKQKKRQQDDFNQRLQLEDQQRALQLYRLQQDQALQDQRQQEDFKRQYDALSSHNDVMNFLFQYGLTGIETQVNDFIDKLIKDVGNRQVTPGDIANQPSPTLSGLTPQQQAAQALEEFRAQYNANGRVITQFAVGAFNLPSAMFAQLHAGETILTQPISQALSRGDISISGRGYSRDQGMVFAPVIQVDARGSNLDENQLVDVIESRVVNNLHLEFERVAKERTP